MTAQGITGPPIPVSDVAGLQATLTDLQDQIDAIDGGGGGGGTPIAIVAGRVSTGNITPQNTAAAVALLTGGPTFSIAASVGDRIECDVNYLTQRNNATFYDLAVIVDGAAVRYNTTGTSTPPVEGDPAMYPDQPAFQGRPGPFRFTAEAGDISGGNVTIGFVVLSAGNGLLYANAAFPMRYALTNYGEAP